eukprot:CAMPEP_0172515236 /NCGR_PEP_ID=MMETSP1066-20121228/266425_1 /TAXON_ID=671091 /ORGANISM="Coscinodiscus wailesii, Strain CCMP2513" /LENGTH=339 /DNA_ID=CAMNT_0013296237 /DNA_START=100 /DNA_END=1116 /DNA_ORIENTATION=+
MPFLSLTRTRVFSYTTCCAIIVSSGNKHLFAFTGTPAIRRPFLRSSFRGAVVNKRTAPAWSSSCRHSTSTCLKAKAPCLIYDDTEKDVSDFNATVIIGKKSYLKDPSSLRQLLNLPNDDDDDMNSSAITAILSSLIKSIKGSSGCASTFLPPLTTDATPHRVSLCLLPSKVSRNNHPLSVHALTNFVSKTSKGGKGRTHLIVKGVSEEDGVTSGAVAAAIARAFPLYSQKSTSGGTAADDDENDSTDDDDDTSTNAAVLVSLIDAAGKRLVDDTTLQSAQYVTEGVQLAARLVDTPPDALSPDEYSVECHRLAEELNRTDEDGARVSVLEITGEELREG